MLYVRTCWCVLVMCNAGFLCIAGFVCEGHISVFECEGLQEHCFPHKNSGQICEHSLSVVPHMYVEL